MLFYIVISCIAALNSTKIHSELPPIIPKIVMPRPIEAKIAKPAPEINAPKAMPAKIIAPPKAPIVVRPMPIQPLPIAKQLVARPIPINAAKTSPKTVSPKVQKTIKSQGISFSIPLTFPIQIFNKSKTELTLNSVHIEYSLDGKTNHPLVAPITKLSAQKLKKGKMATLYSINYATSDETSSPTFEGLTGITVNGQYIAITPKRMTNLDLYLNNAGGSWQLVDAPIKKKISKKKQNETVKAVATAMIHHQK